MAARSPVRTNAIIFSVLGLVVALLIHFIVLSSPKYNWINPQPQALVEHLNMALVYLAAL